MTREFYEQEIYRFWPDLRHTYHALPELMKEVVLRFFLLEPKDLEKLEELIYTTKKQLIGLRDTGSHTLPYAGSDLVTKDLIMM